MYMMTKGKSNIPLIKLSEGFSISAKDPYITLVCGSNGEPLTPVRVWASGKLFNFFKKEYLNGEFVSKTELMCVKATNYKDYIVIELIKYKIPEFMQNNLELEYDSIRKTKPETELLFKVRLDNIQNLDDDSLKSIFDELLDGKFTDVFISAIHKFESTQELLYYKKVGK